VTLIFLAQPECLACTILIKTHALLTPLCISFHTSQSFQQIMPLSEQVKRILHHTPLARDLVKVIFNVKIRSSAKTYTAQKLLKEFQSSSWNKRSL